MLWRRWSMICHMSSLIRSSYMANASVIRPSYMAIVRSPYMSNSYSTNMARTTNYCYSSSWASYNCYIWSWSNNHSGRSSSKNTSNSKEYSGKETNRWSRLLLYNNYLWLRLSNYHSLSNNFRLIFNDNCSLSCVSRLANNSILNVILVRWK